ncbi:MAG: foldase protein PrsA [Gaiellaceae bacterium]|jgi:parvulin-like peptidyl-prolyl isomerase|nr:foldase protein PrsA [Gaiellaceae bacterium]
MKRPLLLAFLLLALVVAGCGGNSTATLSANDAAVVGSKSITKDEFQSLMDRAKKSYDAQKRPFPKPGSTEYEQLKGQAVTFLIQRAEFEQEADAMGIKVTDDKVNKRITQLKKQFYSGSEAKYKQTLKQQGLTEDQAKEEVRAQLISEDLFKKVTGDVTVTKDQIKAYYNSHKSQYGQPQTRDVRHILVAKKALADQLYAQLKSGANFATLAKKYSKDPGSAANGGKLTISKGQTVPAFDKTAFSLKKGQLSPPIHTQYGYHIIEALSGVKAAKTTSLSKVESSIKQQLEQQRKNDAMTKWVETKKKSFCKSGIKYQVGYQPNPDPCTTLAGTTTTTSQ